MENYRRSQISRLEESTRFLVGSYKPPVKPDGSKMFAWSQEQGIDPEIYREWVKMGEKHGWKRTNPVTGVEEPIFDYEASLLAFVDTVAA